jgi:hypothetical protein
MMAIQPVAFPELPREMHFKLMEACTEVNLCVREVCNLREVHSIWKNAIDEVIRTKWNELKHSPPSGPRDLRGLMLQQECFQDPSKGKNFIRLFRNVNCIFRNWIGGRYSGGRWIPGTYSGELSIHFRQFQDLQLRLCRFYADETLMASWVRICPKANLFARVRSTPEAMREWLSDPQTEPLRAATVGIDLWSLRIPCVPEEILCFPNLQSLNLSRNKIEVLPSFLGKIPSLRTLLLTNNFLVELPEELPTWTHIETIELGDNCLQPKALGLLAQWRENKENLLRMGEIKI